MLKILLSGAIEQTVFLVGESVNLTVSCLRYGCSDLFSKISDPLEEISIWGLAIGSVKNLIFKEIMEVRCIKVKLRKNSLNQVRNWFSVLLSRKDEVLETLRKENIIVESAFLDRIGNIDYLIYYIKSPDIKRALEVFKNSCLSIDEFYKKKWRELCEESVVLDVLLDVDLLTHENLR